MIAKAARELKAILGMHLSTHGLSARRQLKNRLKHSARREGSWPSHEMFELKQEDVSTRSRRPTEVHCVRHGGPADARRVQLCGKAGNPGLETCDRQYPEGRIRCGEAGNLGQARHRDSGRTFCRRPFARFPGRGRWIWAGAAEPAFHPPDSLDRRAPRRQENPVFVRRCESGKPHRGAPLSWEEGRSRSPGQPITNRNSRKTSCCAGQRRAGRKSKPSFIRLTSRARRARARRCRLARPGDLPERISRRVILGDFDPAFLALPEEILITVMRGHQKYFAVENRRGELAPHFLAVINLPQDAKGLVSAGHERVLRARFADAQFFWETDQKIQAGRLSAEARSRHLRAAPGSYGDKVERMRSLARWLCRAVVFRRRRAGGCGRARTAPQSLPNAIW